MLLCEYALTPDVLDAASYSSDEVAGIRLQQLKEVLLAEGLVRNLRNGNWSRLFRDSGRAWHKRGKEFLRKLEQQARLRLVGPVLGDEPTTDHEWCHEALESHNVESPLTGIISAAAVAERFRSEPLVEAIQRLSSTPWWTTRSSSVRLARTLDQYKTQLRLMLKCANSVMFIDPHLDPTQTRYGDFLSLLLEMAGRKPAPLLEVHRVCHFGGQDRRNQRDETGWKVMFQSWSQPLLNAGLTAKVFIWDHFHDRYAISNLLGISVPNGFDTTTDLSGATTWTRLGRSERDDIQREFDPASKRHALRHCFKIPEA